MITRQPVSNAIVQRIKSLIDEGSPLSVSVRKLIGFTFDEQQTAEGWLTSAVHVVELVVQNPLSAYRAKCTDLVINSRMKGPFVVGVTQEQIGSMIGVLQSLQKDIEAGLIGDLTDRVRAEVFDDFLDHADAYLKEGRKESGVIAGVVFEDTLRRIAKKYDEQEPKVDTIISNLVTKQVFTAVKGKRARAAADVRTKATHAKWDEFDLSDVRNCIGFTRELITNYLE